MVLFTQRPPRPTLEVLEGLLHVSAFYTLALGADLEAVVLSYVIFGMVAGVDLRCWTLVLFLVTGLELGTYVYSIFNFIHVIHTLPSIHTLDT
jgi:hypothetical protein